MVYTGFEATLLFIVGLIAGALMGYMEGYFSNNYFSDIAKFTGLKDTKKDADKALEFPFWAKYEKIKNEGPDDEEKERILHDDHHKTLTNLILLLQKKGIITREEKFKL